MSDYQPIIDVQPIEHSREQAPHTAHAANASSTRRPSQSQSWNASSSRYSSASAGPIPPCGTAFAQGPTAAAASKAGGSVLGGVARIVVGTGLVMLGVPMLILPGPGLLTIAAGFVLATSGMRRLFG